MMIAWIQGIYRDWQNFISVLQACIAYNFAVGENITEVTD